MHLLHTIWRNTRCRAEEFFRTGSALLCCRKKYAMALLPLLLMNSNTVLAVAPGTLISNTANATFAISGNPENRASNTVDISTSLLLTPAKALFFQYSPSGSGARPTVSSPTGCSLGSASGPFPPLANPDYPGMGVLDVSAPVDLVRAERFHQGEPVFIEITDKNRNLDRTQRDTVEVTVEVAASGDQERLQLSETDNDSGIFVGYIQTVAPAATPFDCRLAVGEDSKIRARYVDVYDNTDTAKGSALVDPFGEVFDSVSGAAINGASVTIVDAATGIPAQVFGDDGVSTFPATVTSGGTATDSNGTRYTFPPGGYRFPFMATGNYRLEVTAPAYTAPSGSTIADLQQLPQAPFALDSRASYAENFTLDAGPPLNIDIPMDPAGSDLFLQKTASRNQAASGDFVRYSLDLVNNSAQGSAANVIVTDVLPTGLRYQKGSTQRNSVSTADPVIADDGRSLRFNAGNLAPGENVQVTYVAEVTVGAPLGEAINVATAQDERGVSSNTARAIILIEDELLTSRSFILGRVMLGNCEVEQPETGSLQLRLQSRVNSGDVIQEVTVTTAHIGGHELGVNIELPALLRYSPGSARIDGQSVPDPTITGNRLNFTLGNATGRSAYTLSFRSHAGVDVNGEFTIRARAVTRTTDGMQQSTAYASNTLRAKSPAAIRVTRADSGDVSSRIVNPPRYDHNATTGVGLPGVPGVRLMMEDGRYVITDEKGMYHFEGLVPGTHVVQVDPLSIPEHLEIFECEQNTRFAGSTHSQFADIAGGLIWRSDFYLREKAPLNGNIGLRLESDLQGRRIVYSARIKGDTHRWDNLRLNIQLAPGLAYIDGSSRLDDTVIADPRVHGDVLSFRLGSREAAAWEQRLDFTVASGDAAAGELDTLAVLNFDTASEKNLRTQPAINSLLLQHDIFGRQPPEPQGRPVDSRNTSRNDSSEQTVTVRRPVTDITIKDDPIVIPAADNDTVQFDRAWLDQAAPGLEWLSPGSDFNPGIPSIKLAIKHDAGDRLELSLNGQAVNNINADGSLRSSDKRQAISRWSGIDLQPGENRIEVIARNASGAITGTLSRNIHFSGMPVYAEFVEEYSRLSADGRTIPVVAVRLTDKWGKPVREGVVGNFRLDPPYIARQRIDALRERPLSGQVLGKTTYTVGNQGIALIEIEPTTITGKLTLFFDFEQATRYAPNVLNRKTREVYAWLKPAARDWILVGLAEGTAGNNNVSGNMETLDAGDSEDNYYQDGRLAFYAKGRIKGDMLMTVAYDTRNESDSERSDHSLFQTINPFKYYTLYGDATDQRFDAPSSEKLYLRIERDQFYALFGDFNTGLTVTELSRYSRSMTGIKTEYDGKRYGVNAFAAESDQVFIRDEIQGNGTSGLYYLSESDIIINSDKITLETRDRFRPGIVVESRELSRFLDYNINTLDGTLFFKQPVPSRDEFFNPVYIVAIYETASAGDKKVSGGGRARVKLLDDRLEIGVSAIHQGDTETGGNLFGTDLRYDISRNTELRLEVANSDTTTGDSDDSGTAYLAQLAHHDPRMSSRLYFRDEDEAFGLGQQSSSNSGTRRYGADLQYLLTENLVVNGEAYHDEVFANNNKRDSATANIEYFRSNYRLSSGLIYTRDDLGTGETNTSTLFTAGASRSFLQDSLILRARAEVPLDSKNQSVDYPGNITLGADYLLNERISLFAEQEFAYGDTQDSSNTRVGLRSSPWALATINTSLEQQVTENGPRLFSNLGLTQGYAVNPHLQLDFGIDRTQILNDSGTTAFNPAVPPSTGTLDGGFTAVYAGSSYARDLWSATSRFEYRNGDTENQRGLFIGVYRQHTPGLGLSLASQLIDADLSSGGNRTTADTRFSVAYRPISSRLILLNRLDFDYEDNDESDISYKNRKVVNNLNLNLLPNRRNQIALHYGIKYGKDTIDGVRYDGLTQALGSEYRYDLNARWDVGLQGSVLYSSNSNTLLYSAGPSVGVNLFKNLWLSTGYNFAGYDDNDFSGAGYTSRGPYAKLRFKFDSGTTKDVAAWWEKTRNSLAGGRKTNTGDS